MQEVPLPLPCQESPNGGRTQLEEESPRLIIDMERPMDCEVLHEECHASCSIPPSHRNRPTPPTLLPSLPSDMPEP